MCVLVRLCTGDLPSRAGQAWIDIDLLNMDNLVACSEYAEDILEHLRHSQVSRHSATLGVPQRMALHPAGSAHCTALVVVVNLILAFRPPGCC